MQDDLRELEAEAGVWGVSVEKVRQMHARNSGNAGDENGRSRAKNEFLFPSPLVARWKSFSVGALPGKLQDYVGSVSDAIGCDPSMVGLPVLVCLAGVIGNRRTITLKHGWSEPSVLWGAIVARSGRLKSPAQDEVTRHLRQGEASRIEGEIRARAEYERELQKWNDLPKKIRGERPIEPDPIERVVISDTTVEALASRLSTSPSGLLLYRDELAGWVRSFDAYKKGGRGDTQAWLEMHRAGSVIVDRKNGATISVPRAAVSILGGVQPEILRESLGLEHIHDGLAARLLFAMPPDKEKKWSDAEISRETREPWGKLLDELLSLPQGDEPLPLPLTTEARSLFIEFYDSNAQRMADAETDALAASLAKLEGYAARLSLIVQLAESPRAAVVGRGAMGSGIKLAQWFRNEAERVYGAWRETPAQRDRRELVDWITRQGGETTERKLSNGPRQYRADGAAERALSLLVREGSGEWITPESPDALGRGRPTRIFRVSRSSSGDGNENEESPGNSPISSPDDPEWEPVT